MPNKKDKTIKKENSLDKENTTSKNKDKSVIQIDRKLFERVLTYSDGTLNILNN